MSLGYIRYIITLNSKVTVAVVTVMTVVTVVSELREPGPGTALINCFLKLCVGESNAIKSWVSRSMV